MAPHVAFIPISPFPTSRSSIASARLAARDPSRAMFTLAPRVTSPISVPRVRTLETPMYVPAVPAPPPGGVAMPAVRALVWHHVDLRFMDNPVLLELEKNQNPASVVLPVVAGWGMREEAKGMREELAAKLDAVGSGLVCARGNAEHAIVQLCEKFGLNVVYWNRADNREAVEIERRVQDALSRKGVEMKTFWGNWLTNPEEEGSNIGLRDIAKKRYGEKGDIKIGGEVSRLPGLPGKQGVEFVKGRMGNGESLGRRVLETIRKEKEIRVIDGRDVCMDLKRYLDYGALSRKMVARKTVEVLGRRGGKTFSELVWRDYVGIVMQKNAGKVSSKVAVGA